MFIVDIWFFLFVYILLAIEILDEQHTVKKENQIFSIYKEIQLEQLQSHKWLTTSSYMGKYLRISSYIRKPFLIYDFATAPLWISLYMRKIWFFFL